LNCAVSFDFHFAVFRLCVTIKIVLFSPVSISGDIYRWWKTFL